MNFFNLSSTEKEAINFLQERGVLSSARICPSNYLAKLYLGKKKRDFGNVTLKNVKKKVNIRI